MRSLENVAERPRWIDLVDPSEANLREHLPPGIAPTALGDEVDQLLEPVLLARPVETPDLGIPGRARLVDVGCVDYAEQVLQPELLPILGVIRCPLNIEEQVPFHWFRQR